MYYSYSTHNIVPAYDYHALYETYETFRNLGIKNISTEFVTNGSQLTYFQDLRLYLMAKFMNDTSLNVDQISKEFIDLYYGSASEKMFELLKTCNNNMKSTYTDENTVFETHNNQKYWPKDVVNKIEVRDKVYLLYI